LIILDLKEMTLGNWSA